MVRSTRGTRVGAQGSLDSCFSWPPPFRAAGGGPRPVSRGRSWRPQAGRGAGQGRASPSEEPQKAPSSLCCLPYSPHCGFCQKDPGLAPKVSPVPDWGGCREAPGHLDPNTWQSQSMEAPGTRAQEVVSTGECQYSGAAGQACEGGRGQSGDSEPRPWAGGLSCLITCWEVGGMEDS